MARVLISMPESFLGKIDEVAENESRSRSELIREALRSYITKSQVRQNTLADKKEIENENKQRAKNRSYKQ